LAGFHGLIASSFYRGIASPPVRIVVLVVPLNVIVIIIAYPFIAVPIQVLVTILGRQYISAYPYTSIQIHIHSGIQIIINTDFREEYITHGLDPVGIKPWWGRIGQSMGNNNRATSLCPQ